MRNNNKSILEGDDESEKFVGRLLSYKDYKIKGDTYENSMSNRVWT